MADIQFKDVTNHRQLEVWGHVSFNKAQRTPKCNMCFVTLTAGASSIKILIGRLK